MISPTGTSRVGDVVGASPRPVAWWWPPLAGAILALALRGGTWLGIGPEGGIDLVVPDLLGAWTIDHLGRTAATVAGILAGAAGVAVAADLSRRLAGTRAALATAVLAAGAWPLVVQALLPRSGVWFGLLLVLAAEAWVAGASARRPKVWRTLAVVVAVLACLGLARIGGSVPGLPGEASLGTDPIGALVHLFGDEERGLGYAPHVWRAGGGPLSWPVLPSTAVLLGLTVAGVLFGARRSLRPILGLVVVAGMALLAGGVESAARGAWLLLLGVSAGMGLDVLLGLAAERRWGKATAVLAVILLVGLASAADRWVAAGERAVREARTDVQWGLTALERHQEDRALDLLSRALALDRDHPDPRFPAIDARAGQVRALYRRQRFEEASSVLAELERLAPEDPRTRLLRGQDFLWHHDYRRALPIFRELSTSHPRLAGARLGWAWCQIHNHAYTAALANVEAAEAVTGPTAESLAARGVIALLGSRNPEQARHLFREALRRDWQQPWAHRFLGEIYRVDRDLPRMYYHLRECLRLDPENDRVRRFLNRSGVALEHSEGEPRPPLD